VVIAIIAILAAILFPVFAEAKMAAKITVELAELKQLGAATYLYINDSDDTFPLGSDANFVAWPVFIGPYCKSIDIFRSPLDTPKLRDVPMYDSSFGWGPNGSAEGGKLGVAISFGANADVADLPIRQFVGLFPHLSGTFTVPTPSRAESSVTHTAETVLMAPTYTAQYQKSWGGIGIGIASKAPWGNLFVKNESDDIRYGLVPNGHIGFIAPYSRYGYRAGSGTVSILPGRVKANFAFADGHVKSMEPIRTNPDEEARPLDNMWNSIR